MTNDKCSDNKQELSSCSKHILETLKRENRALYYSDFGTKYAYGTLRNNINVLVENQKVLRLPKEKPSRFILSNWAHRPEYSCIQRNDKTCMAGKFDFLQFLEKLPWSSNLSVHNLKLSFAVYRLNWLENKNWKYCKNSRSYNRDLELSFPVRIQCFDTGTVLVSIKSSCRPFTLDISGLLSISGLLGELRNALHSPVIPEPSTWVIVQWHFNRDSEPMEGSGLDFHITFRDFFSAAARIYYKHELMRVRAEVNQSPNRTLKEVFEEIIDRNNFSKENA